MKTALVTGGASGIGRAIAQRLERDGHHVATIDLQPSEADFSYAADVTDRAQVDAALGKIHEQLGPVSVLVNAAGLDGFSRFSPTSRSTSGRECSTSTSTGCSTAVRP